MLPYVAGNNVALSKGASLLGGNPVFSPVQLQSALAVMARDASSQGGDSQKELRNGAQGGKGRAKKSERGESRMRRVGGWGRGEGKCIAKITATLDGRHS